MNFPRTLTNSIKKASAHFPVVIVTGARQVGKTTLLRMLDQQRNYVTLDNPLNLDLARKDPALFLQRFTPPLLIDEIQYAPELLPHIKMYVDENKKSGLFWLTGSQPFHLMRGVSESLAGRVAVMQLLGFSRQEMLRQGDKKTLPFLPTPEVLHNLQNNSIQMNLQELYQIIWRGSFPALVTQPELEPELFYSSYLQTYLQRDIHDLARVGDEMAFLRFLRAAAARTGQLLNFADLARDTDVAPNTAKQWLSILETSGIVYLLRPWHTNLSKRLVKTPKLYFLDTGLCAYLTQWSSPTTLEAGAMSGAFFETWIMSELLKSYWHQGKQAPFYYFRDKDQREIDLLIERDGLLYPVEFKKSASPAKDALKTILSLEKLSVPLGTGAIICMVPELLPLNEKHQAVPAYLL